MLKMLFIKKILNFALQAITNIVFNVSNLCILCILYETQCIFLNFIVVTTYFIHVSSYFS